ncbi:hypothetical protein GCM10018793_60380 [Streptomyces sulfonofaciens]|uniref:N-acetyltransferase domain-containing protein n=1 Tax=Streptomyces sulfonofaciens TaxID=68272 RepID=A0A919GMW7_9ACTN|nr:GNAT family N-acetyltransferase [Streptomyces sulfonofaciens]GHH86851.1 hypothetical protein GCM10018793_60380 [Streptomyces sulfonofaciens]
MHEMRRATAADHPAFAQCVRKWGGDFGPPSVPLPRLLVEHAAATSLVLEDETGVRAFLIGLHTAGAPGAPAAADPREACVHFVAVDPGLRRQGIGRALCTTFFERAAAAGSTAVRAAVPPENAALAFHRALGFQPADGDRRAQGLPVHSDYDGPGQDRVVLRRELDAPAPPAPPALAPFTVRRARPEDFDTVIAVVDDWWGRPASRDLTRLFVGHFFSTSLIAERDGALAGFVIGFLSPSKPEEAYIHFTGVAPAWRRSGLGRFLYERFFAAARADGRTVVKAITSPQNSRSIAFHNAMGFADSDPIPDYDGPSLHRVTFTRPL